MSVQVSFLYGIDWGCHHIRFKNILGGRVRSQQRFPRSRSANVVPARTSLWRNSRLLFQQASGGGQGCWQVAEPRSWTRAL